MRTFRITVDGTPYDVTVEETTDGAAPAPSAASTQTVAAPVAAPVAAAPAPAAPAPAAAATAAAAGPGDVASPMAGTVVKVEVAVGAAVEQGQTVITLEAMKMNTSVTAPRSGKVASIAVTAGTSVAEGQLLMTIA